MSFPNPRISTLCDGWRTYSGIRACPRGAAGWPRHATVFGSGWARIASSTTSCWRAARCRRRLPNWNASRDPRARPGAVPDGSGARSAVPDRAVVAVLVPGRCARDAVDLPLAARHGGSVRARARGGQDARDDARVPETLRRGGPTGTGRRDLRLPRSGPAGTGLDRTATRISPSHRLRLRRRDLPGRYEPRERVEPPVQVVPEGGDDLPNGSTRHGWQRVSRSVRAGPVSYTH